MIIKNISGKTIYFSWIGKYGKKIKSNGELEINDLYVSSDKFRLAKDSGIISIVSYDSNEASIATQGEIEAGSGVTRVDEFFEYIYYGGFEASQTDIEIYESSGIIKRIYVPKNGSVITCSIESSLSRINGYAEGKPTINGIKISTELLTVKLDEDNEKFNNKYISYGNVLFSKDDNVGFMLTSDASWEPTNTNIIIRIGVSYNSE